MISESEPTMKCTVKDCFGTIRHEDDHFAKCDTCGAMYSAAGLDAAKLKGD
jgi:hypothetical protein